MSDENNNTAANGDGRPSFGALPEELEAFRGTDYELIPLDGKVPSRRNWRHAAALELDDAKQRLAEGVGNAGVRLRDGDLVVDVDPRHFEEGQDGLARLTADLGIDLSDYPTVETGSNGLHIYMALDEGVKVVNGLEAYPGVEFKAFGRQVVAPGSVHPVTGKPYMLDPLSAPFTPRKAAPTALVAAITRPERAAAEPGDCTPEQLAEMLEALDPTDYRGQTPWLELMMASHHATGGDGLEEFVAWSTADPAYVDHAHKIGARWNSLHVGGAGSQVTQRTLFMRVIDAGRQDLIPRSDPADDFPDDLDDVPDFIGEQQAKTTVLDRVNADRFTVLTGGKYLVGREQTDPRTGVFSVEWYAPEAVRQHMNVRSVETPDGKSKPMGNWWLEHPKRRQYDGVVFDPTPGAKHPSHYNLWRGWAIEPRKGDWTKMQRLIRDVLCGGDAESYEYVVRWMAHMVQHPSRPAEVALVFKGRKGTGKGTLCRALVELAGKHGRQVTSPDHFTGRFNEHLADTILLFVDEGFWAGDKKAEGQLKGLVTEKTLTFEGKGKPIVQGPNQLHVVMASNEDWVVPATADERRFAVFEADEAAARAFPHFADLIEDGGAQRKRIMSAMLYDLLRMELGDWHPRRDIPQTRALLDQKLEGLRKSPLDAWWYDCLEAGEIATLVGTTKHWPDAWHADPAAKELVLLSLRTSRKDAAGVTKTKLAQYLGSAGVGVGDKVRNRQNQKVWAVPSLADARLAFERKMGGAIDWAD